VGFLEELAAELRGGLGQWSLGVRIIEVQELG
jgi:hypothetical protein